MYFYYTLALLAALSWSIASLISTDITRKIGSLNFNSFRLIFVSLMLIVYTTISNKWSTIQIEYLNLIILSGIVGILLGDSFLFIALKRIGPRRNNILFSLAAPFTVILNILILQQKMSYYEISGCVVVFVGVVIAIAYGTNKSINHRWEKIEGSINIGILMGVLAAFCQAVGLIMVKPILNLGADPIATAAIRTTISALIISFTFIYNFKNIYNNENFNLNIILKIIISGFLGMALGMSLLLIALQKGDAGIVATLSSTGPVMILLLLWFTTKKIPSLGAWIGTIIAIIGTGLIFIY
tara:strand:+ start:741 stop:1634 length:894 start_codon:yes stop_codon:yes gene_type:complete